MTNCMVLRHPTPERLVVDLRWVSQHHGEIYAREYGFNAEFEALVEGICLDFQKNFQPDAERCCIAEMDGVRVGSVFVVKLDDQTAKLRMLIVGPHARGMRLGARLTDEAIAFSRARGYKKLVLWTNACLLTARNIYDKRGFKLTHTEQYRGFGQDLVSETWEMLL
jgi:ribosomal protein S18 acetylase RimI-like enzyme